MAEKRFSRNPDIVERDVDDAAFLVGSDGDSLYHLNPLAKALWALMAEPITIGEASDVICEAFPGVDGKEIERDVTALISDLEANGLLVIVES